MNQARVVWTSGHQMVAESGTGHAVVLDTPADGGRNTGPTPMELLLMAHGGCTTVDVVYILGERMKKPLTGVEVEITGERAQEVPKVYTKLNVLYRVRGKGLKQKDVERALSLSANKYCSVSIMLGKTAEIHVRYELLDELTGETLSGDIAHA